MTGKRGLAPNPSQVRDGEISEVGLVEPAQFLRDEELEDRDVISEGNAPRSQNASTED